MKDVKYAILTVGSDNIGDNGQNYALYHLYRQLRIPEEDIVFIYIDDARLNPDIHYILPLVTADLFYFEFIIRYIISQDASITFIPIALGQTRNTFVDENRLGKFRNVIDKFSEPIGCRDYDSASLYEALGYNTYVNGCITNTLPLREEKNYDKIYIIDVPKELFGFIPKSILDKAIFLTQHSPLHDGRTSYACATERYNLLRDTAALVITCRYHIATPCNAMGIPVIMVENNSTLHHWTFDVRFNAMNPNIPFYTKEQWNDIDWEPKPVSFEDAKQTMIDLTGSRIKNAATLYSGKQILENFYAPSKKRFWDIFSSNKHRIDCFGFIAYLDVPFLSKIPGNFSYYLYGLSDRYTQTGECLLLDYIQKHYPNAEFLGFVDIHKSGRGAFGKEVIHPNDMKVDNDTYVIVSAYTANDYLKKFFDERGHDAKHLFLMPDQLLLYCYRL